MLRPCCAHHSPWRAQLLIRLARQQVEHGDPLAARSALQQAKADAPHLSQLDHALGRLEEALGFDEQAADRLAKASRSAEDPLARTMAALGAERAEARLRSPDGSSLRDAALVQLDRGCEASARALALAARTSDPDPIADLLLRHQLQETSGDTRGSLGTALLLREYGVGWTVDQLLAQDFERAGQRALADRAGARLLLAIVPQPMLRRWRREGQDWLAGTRQRWWPDALAAPAR